MRRGIAIGLSATVLALVLQCTSSTKGTVDVRIMDGRAEWRRVDFGGPRAEAAGDAGAASTWFTMDYKRDGSMQPLIVDGSAVSAVVAWAMDESGQKFVPYVMNISFGAYCPSRKSRVSVSVAFELAAPGMAYAADATSWFAQETGATFLTKNKAPLFSATKGVTAASMTGGVKFDRIGPPTTSGSYSLVAKDDKGQQLEVAGDFEVPTPQRAVSGHLRLK